MLIVPDGDTLGQGVFRVGARPKFSPLGVRGGRALSIATLFASRAEDGYSVVGANKATAVQSEPPLHQSWHSLPHLQQRNLLTCKPTSKAERTMTVVSLVQDQS